jgi:hypothetical protein
MTITRIGLTISSNLRNDQVQATHNQALSAQHVEYRAVLA